MKIKIIDKNRKDEKVWGIRILISQYDFRMGFVPLGHPTWEGQRLRNIKETLYYIIREDNYRHFRFLWFACGWQKIGKKIWK